MCGAPRRRELQLQNTKAGALCMESATLHLIEMIWRPGLAALHVGPPLNNQGGPLVIPTLPCIARVHEFRLCEGLRMPAP
jgi:hypothetical protein